MMEAPENFQPGTLSTVNGNLHAYRSPDGDIFRPAGAFLTKIRTAKEIKNLRETFTPSTIPL